MPKYPVDKQTAKRILILASKMPLVWVNSHEKHIMTKAELDEMGYVGATDLGDGKYMYKAPVMVAKNHYRCMRRRYEKHGVAGLDKYIDEIKELKDA